MKLSRQGCEASVRRRAIEDCAKVADAFAAEPEVDLDTAEAAATEIAQRIRALAVPP